MKSKIIKIFKKFKDILKIIGKKIIFILKHNKIELSCFLFCCHFSGIYIKNNGGFIAITVITSWALIFLTFMIFNLRRFI